MEETERVVKKNWREVQESYFNNKNCINLQLQLVYQLSRTHLMHSEHKNKLREEGIFFLLLFILKPYPFSETSINLNDSNKPKRPLG